ncbi:MAG: AI-2E family transporter [Chloroflexota bacterium]
MESTGLSPKWGGTTKIIISITFVAIAAGLLIKFQGLMPQLIIIILLAYLFNPIADFLSRKLHMSWRVAVSVVYLFAVLLILSLLTISGVGLVQQLQNMFTLVQDSVKNIPMILKDLSGREFSVGPFLFDLRKVDLSLIGQQMLGSIEPLLGRTGTMVSTLAGGAANLLGWTLFVMLASYFVLSESDGFWQGILHFNIPGYQQDLQKISLKLAQIWNSFLRGQLIVMTLAAAIYLVTLSTLGVSYALGLALFAGLARFVPYVGPLILWIVLALVSYFQDFKLMGLSPLSYALIVVAIAWLIDGITDNFIMPRIMATSLNVHPAAVLIAAIIGLDLLGILGVIIAAPMLATLQLIGRYFARKLFDLDPWDGWDDMPPEQSIRKQIKIIYNRLVSKLKKK